MNKTELYNKAVSLNLPSSLCDDMDKIADELGMTRTSFLHQSIQRNVDYMNKVELPLIRERQSNYNHVRRTTWLVGKADKRSVL